ncbi:two-component system, NtrC family, response regulator PilR [Persephonella hydrogeniphila]|uniref:Two-component system, NtrC family, response regulator PilR n=1 Tax=Persephonella hydrogeniphila TaxID=198703 RepID=A0A285NLA3_9AQUI|nr:sigma-54 dependent transcriptional regulator [Persephonella hydrogeniphila]SNZ10280.1 two-component system, NtrC family, response regulator PilR [Persephonella hydrogeniphila]
MKALIVDDELNIQEILGILLEDFGFEVDKASNKKEADKLIEQNYYDLALLDLRLPDGSGIEILKKLKEKNPKTEVVIITAFASSETAVEAIKLGAYDYISKPFEVNELRLLIRNVKNKLELERKLAEKKDQKFEGLIGRSPAIQVVKETIEKVASYDINVLIVGESGTGKDIVARTIHKLSNRSDKPFVAINCASLPAELLESELFGYKKGAFTGATTDKKGLIEEANGGTLFLDEIGEMPMPLQAKLLRFLETKKIRPLGSVKEIDVDVRIISATNKNLEEEIEKGNFREDLYYRLSTITIRMPSLKERKEDIPLLVESILKELKEKYNKEFDEVSPEFLNYLMQYDYKGNIRELKNILEKAVILSEGRELSLPKYETNSINSIYIDNPDENFTVKTFPEEGIDLKKVLSNIEKSLLEKAMEKSNGNKTKASQILGLTFREFRYRYDKYKQKTNS